jgi:hypothetical protein
MNTTSRGIGRRPVLTLALAIASALIVPALASAHARVSPPVSVAGKLQLYSPCRPDREEQPDDEQDRDPRGVRDRLVRAAPARLATEHSADRVGR